MDRGGVERRGRQALLVAVAVTALVAVAGGLERLGVLAVPVPVAVVAHGPLFVCGVFLSVIALERAVALAHAWAYLAPALGAAAGLALIAGLPGAAALAVLAAVALVAVNGVIVVRQPALHTALMSWGAVVLAVGSFAWASGRPVYEALLAWLAFFVLTIQAERLELSRLAPTPRWAAHLLAGLAIGLGGLACLAVGREAETALRAAGLPILLIGGWQLRFDIARHTVRRPGLPRFAAVGVLLGATWLVVAGALLLGGVLPPAGPRYDAVVHAVLVGFVLSMVFAHAPIVLPAVAGVAVPFHRILYLPMAVLHLGLAVRVFGDLSGRIPWRRSGGLANAVALVLFVGGVILARRRAPSPR